MLPQALNISAHPAKINGTKIIYHATFRQSRSESAVSMLSLKKTPLGFIRKSLNTVLQSVTLFIVQPVNATQVKILPA